MFKLHRSDIIGWKTEYAAPTGLNFFLVWFYKDAAPTALGKDHPANPIIGYLIKRRDYSLSSFG
jgi:hypothetical protein